MSFYWYFSPLVIYSFCFVVKAVDTVNTPSFNWIYWMYRRENLLYSYFTAAVYGIMEQKASALKECRMKYLYNYEKYKLLLFVTSFSKGAYINIKGTILMHYNALFTLVFQRIHNKLQPHWHTLLDQLQRVGLNIEQNLGPLEHDLEKIVL